MGNDVVRLLKLRNICEHCISLMGVIPSTNKTSVFNRFNIKIKRHRSVKVLVHQIKTITSMPYKRSSFLLLFMGRGATQQRKLSMLKRIAVMC